ncbi:glycine zipper family protein [Cupriavidus sp. BIS7]|uniref:glycine zipper family protein n=1 Tax=Cupriavidus sp. BIS7 TaxID=1217718 RepID=UPI0002F04470|nr:glycine zipper family protein [Cupriavidus sp. BIS7]
MKPRSVPLLLAAASVLGACTSMPSGPSVMALPGTNKSLDQFRGDDRNCRQFALGQLSGVSSHQASTSAAGASSTSSTSYAGDDAQQQYDAAYVQCMYASGHRVPVYGPMIAAPPATPPANYKPNTPPPAPAPQGHAP